MQMQRVLWGLLALLTASVVNAQSFTYQGLLKDSGSPANGSYDFRFLLWTQPTGGSQVGPELYVDAVSVQNGLFTVQLDFGSVWDGSDRYLEIRVRRTGQFGYWLLQPRVKINPTPYALFALRPWQTAGSAVFYNDGNVGIGTNAPAARLSLGGGDANTKLALWQGGAAGEVMGFGIAPNQFRLHLHNPSNRFSFLDAPNGSELLTIQGNGNVGVGLTNPTAKLHIRGGNLRIDDGEIQSWGPITLHPDTNNTGDDIVRFVDSAGGEVMRIHSDGNVGIGTSSPQSRLHIETGVGASALRVVHTATSGHVDGVKGVIHTPRGAGVSGEATAASGETYGGWFQSNSPNGYGVVGIATATSGRTRGVYGRINSTRGAGVFGKAPVTSGYATGVAGQSDSSNGIGVFGTANRISGGNYGGYFRTNSSQGMGVVGYAATNITNTRPVGVLGHRYGDTLFGYGVYSVGTLVVNGFKEFQIDHPLRPETHYLNHFCAEGPEPYNAYSGNVVTDAQGYATVTLPPYFESINRDFRYQLICIGQLAQAIVAEEIKNNRFVIRTDKPNVKVSWRVEAVRNDLWVQRHGFQAEQEKAEWHRGKYLNPELYRQPKEQGIYYHPELARPGEGEKPK